MLDPIKKMAKLGRAAARLPAEAQALRTLVGSGMVGSKVEILPQEDTDR